MHIKPTDALGILLPGHKKINILLAILTIEPIKIKRVQVVSFLHFFKNATYLKISEKKSLDEFNIPIEYKGINIIEEKQLKHLLKNQKKKRLKAYLIKIYSDRFQLPICLKEYIYSKAVL